MFAAQLSSGQHSPRHAVRTLPRPLSTSGCLASSSKQKPGSLQHSYCVSASASEQGLPTHENCFQDPQNHMTSFAPTMLNRSHTCPLPSSAGPSLTSACPAPPCTRHLHLPRQHAAEAEPRLGVPGGARHPHRRAPGAGRQDPWAGLLRSGAAGVSHQTRRHLHDRSGQGVHGKPLPRAACQHSSPRSSVCALCCRASIPGRSCSPLMSWRPIAIWLTRLMVMLQLFDRHHFSPNIPSTVFAPWQSDGLNCFVCGLHFAVTS